MVTRLKYVFCYRVSHDWQGFQPLVTKVTNDFAFFCYIYGFYSCPTSRPRVSDLVNGKISKFTIDALLNMLAKTGKTAELNIRA